MKIKVCLIAVLTLGAASAAAEEYDAARVKAECSQEWAGQFDMIKYCIQKRQDGLKSYTQLKIVADAVEPLQAAMAHCETEWQQQWDMVSYCAEKQIEGANTLVDLLKPLPETVQSEIMTQCYPKWYPQFDMIAYCATKQAGAWRELSQ